MRTCNQYEQAGNAFFWQGTIADVLAWEGFLMHLRAHVAGIYPVDAPRGVFGSEYVRKLFQRGLARAIAAPAFVGFNACITGDVDHAGTSFQLMLQRLN